jgi:hypothetical protein
MACGNYVVPAAVLNPNPKTKTAHAFWAWAVGSRCTPMLCGYYY